MHSIRFFDRQATPYAFLQPTEQRRPYPCHSSSRCEPRPQRLPQRQRRRKTCRIGRRPPRNIVPTRAELSLLKLCRVQPILCNTAPTPSIHSTSAARLFVPTRAERNLFRLCRVQLNLVHLCTNSRSTILSASRYQAFHDPIRLGKS